MNRPQGLWRTNLKNVLGGILLLSCASTITYGQNSSLGSDPISDPDSNSPLEELVLPAEQFPGSPEQTTIPSAPGTPTLEVQSGSVSTPTPNVPVQETNVQHIQTQSGQPSAPVIVENQVTNEIHNSAAPHTPSYPQTQYQSHGSSHSGVRHLSESLNGEMIDLSRAIRGLNQSYYFKGHYSGKAWTAGSGYLEGYFDPGVIDHRCRSYKVIEPRYERYSRRWIPRQPVIQPIPPGVHYPQAVHPPVVQNPAPLQLPELQLPEQHQIQEADVIPAWPLNQTGLVFYWKFGIKQSLDYRGLANLDAKGHFQLASGAVLAPQFETRLLTDAKKSHQLTLEAVFNSHSLRQEGPSRLLTFSSGAHSRNFTLGQTKDHLVLRLRTTRNDHNGTNPEIKLTKIKAGNWYHILISYREGLLTCYLNGKPIEGVQQIKGNFSNWEKQHLLFGDEWNGERDWIGALERIAIYTRFIEANEALQLYKAARLPQ